MIYAQVVVFLPFGDAPDFLKQCSERDWKTHVAYPFEETKAGMVQSVVAFADAPPAVRVEPE